jgi:hypothetical protein
MPNPNFLQPSYNKIIEQDPQIIKVNLEYTEWGARKSNLSQNTVNDMTLEHASQKGK